MMRSEFGNILQVNSTSYDHPNIENYSSPEPDINSNIFLNNHKDSSSIPYTSQIISNKHVGQQPQSIKVERHEVNQGFGDKNKKTLNSSNKLTTTSSKAQLKPKNK